MLQYLKEIHSDAEREEEEVRFKFDKSCEYILLQLGDQQNGWIVHQQTIPTRVCFLMAIICIINNS